MWITFAILSAFTAALVAIFGKIGLAHVDTTLATALRAGIMFIFLVLAALFTKKLPELGTIQGRAMLFIVLSGIAGALSWLFYFLALKLGPAGRVASIDRLSLVFIVILAALFLAEKITLKIGLGVLLMTAGALVIALP